MLSRYVIRQDLGKINHVFTMFNIKVYQVSTPRVIYVDTIDRVLVIKCPIRILEKDLFEKDL